MSFYQNHRPCKFQDVVGQESITYVLANQIKRHKVGNAYLFAGPSGTGKTSCARILANALAGNEWDIIEIDGARFRGIDDVKELAYKANFSPLGGGYKVYIIDEAHMITEPGFNAMLKLLEDTPPYLVIILCSSKPDSIPETVRSRCQVFQFQPIDKKAMFTRLQHICRWERMTVSDTGLEFISTMASGNLRIAETMLEQSRNLNHGSPSVKQIKTLLQRRMV